MASIPGYTSFQKYISINYDITITLNASSRIILDINCKLKKMNNGRTLWVFEHKLQASVAL